MLVAACVRLWHVFDRDMAARLTRIHLLAHAGIHNCLRRYSMVLPLAESRADFLTVSCPDDSRVSLRITTAVFAHDGIVVTVEIVFIAT